ncbi:MAG: hypothetical protein PSV35_08590, partial [bacterium]|nr:hypothetical protein [bacterium]
ATILAGKGITNTSSLINAYHRFKLKAEQENKPAPTIRTLLRFADTQLINTEVPSASLVSQQLEQNRPRAMEF